MLLGKLLGNWFPHMAIWFIKIPSSLVSLLAVRLPICFKNINTPETEGRHDSPRSSPWDKDLSSLFWRCFWEPWCRCGEHSGEARKLKEVGCWKDDCFGKPRLKPSGQFRDEMSNILQSCPIRGAEKSGSLSSYSHLSLADSYSQGPWILSFLSVMPGPGTKAENHQCL